MLDKKDDISEEKAAMMSIADVATRCGVSKRTVHRWINDDGLPVHRMPGSGSRPITRVGSSDLRGWLDQHRHSSAADDEHNKRTLRLDGRRFIRAGSSAVPRKIALDCNADSRPRADRYENGGR